MGLNLCDPASSCHLYPVLCRPSYPPTLDAGFMLFLSFVLVFTTVLLCYAGYVFLIVDRRQESTMLSDSDLFNAIDNKNYDFEMPEEIDEYEELRESQPGDK